MSGKKRKRTSKTEPRDSESESELTCNAANGSQRIDSSEGDLGDVDVNEQIIQSSLRYYPEEVQPVIHSVCSKYGSSRFREIFQLANTIGSHTNSLPYLQVLGMPGTGKYSLVRDMLKMSGSVFGYVNGAYAKWLCHSKGGCVNKISVENLFIRPVEQIRRKLTKKGVFSTKKRRSRVGLFEGEPESPSTSANSIIEFVDELRLIKKEYSEYLQRQNGGLEDETSSGGGSTKDGEEEEEEDGGRRVVSRCIFLIVKDVTTISKSRPDLLLTLMKLHEHLRDVMVLPGRKERPVVRVNYCVIFIDNFGIPEDFFCTHSPFPVIWFSSYNDVESFDIMANLRLGSDVKEMPPHTEEVRKACCRRNSRSILVNSLLSSYVKGSIDFLPGSEAGGEAASGGSGIRLNLLKETEDADKNNIIPIEVLHSMWTEYVAELTVVLHPYIKSDFREVVFKILNLWPVFLLPLVSGELYFTRSTDIADQVHLVTQALLKLFKRHYGVLTRNFYSHYLPELFQGDLISNNKNASGVLNYGFLKNVSQVNMPYFTKLLLISAYVASKVPKKEDKTLFRSLVASKLSSRRGRRRPRKQGSEKDDSRRREAFSLIRWIAIADCIALHITGSQGIDLSVPIFEQISDIVRLGLVIPVSGRWSQLVLSRGEAGGQLNNISPVQDLSIGQNIGVEIAMYRQGSFGFSNSSYVSTNHLKQTHSEPPINIEDPRTLYILQAPSDMIETFSVEVGVILNEVIPEN